MSDVLATEQLIVSGPTPAPVAVPDRDVRTRVRDGVRIDLHGDAVLAVLAVPGTVFGPDLGLHVRFDEPGAHRLFAQLRLADGHVVTAPFVVHVHVHVGDGAGDAH